MPSQYAKDFSLMPGHVWLNVASEGPLPKAAVKALQEAVEWKNSPHLLTIPKFQQVPVSLKKTIARLINADWQDVILGNSATYGLHLLANGVSFKRGDEIILLQNDFPTDILPWLSLENKGVVVRQVKALRHVLTPRELRKAVNPRTKAVCLPLIHSFTGYKLDVGAVSELCRSRGIVLILNISQAAGAMALDINRLGADAVVCAGYKWLLGPYGTGFCWIRKEIREQLDYAQNYWISLMDEASLSSEGPLVLKDDHSARRYDVFGTANFFNFVPWQASIEYLLDKGLDNIEAHNRALLDILAERIDRKKFEVISPCGRDERTNIFVFSHQEVSRNPDVFAHLKAQGFYAALWKNKIRVSPHIYNTLQEMEGLAGALDQYGQTGVKML